MTVWTQGSRAELARAAGSLADAGLPVAEFAVLHGNGNVIAIVELDAVTDLSLSSLRAATIVVCETPTENRVDGVLFCYPRHERGLRMVFFDRDGTWEAMCGNGLRCLTRYVADRGLIDGRGVIVTDDGPKAVRVERDGVAVTLGPPREVRQVADDRWFAYTGVPHLVVFLSDVDQLDAVDVAVEGARLRYDMRLCRELGHPEGVHVDFMAPRHGVPHVRTYEVGVEAETLCCGTGVAAVAYLGWRARLTPLPTTVRTRGGDVTVELLDGQLSVAGEVGYLVPPDGSPWLVTPEIAGESW